jgi:hypothetical protein
MYRNQLLRVAVVVVGSVATLSLLHCSQPASVIGPPGGGGSGSSGQGGSTTVRQDAAPVGADLPPAVVNMDVQPIWYGTSDAPQGDDSPPAPNADVNCGITSSETTRKLVDVMLVLDRSASMDWNIGEDCYCSTTGGTGVQACADTTNCTTRWNSVKPAVTSTLSSTNYVNWGLKFFPTPGASSNCIESTTMEVPITTTSAADVETEVNNATLSLSTPTAAALTAAADYLKTLDDGNKKFILLATDGEPNCGKNSRTGQLDINTPDVPGAADAAKAAFDAGISVYVIGIGPNLGNLTQIAKSGSGDAKDYYSVTTPQQLADALTAISEVVGSCTFQSKTAPPDPENVAVYVNKQLIAKDANEGWDYGATKQDIELHGKYCDDIMAGQETSVQILFGCPGAPPFPPFVP